MKWGRDTRMPSPSGDVGTWGCGDTASATVIKTKQGISSVLDGGTPSNGGCEGGRVSVSPSPHPHIPTRPAQAFRASLGAAA